MNRRGFLSALSIGVVAPVIAATQPIAKLVPTNIAGSGIESGAGAKQANSLVGLTYYANTFIATDAVGNVAFSSDGITWSATRFNV